MKFFVTSSVAHRIENGIPAIFVACGYCQATNEDAVIEVAMAQWLEKNSESDGYFKHQVFALQAKDEVILEAAEDIRNAKTGANS